MQPIYHTSTAMNNNEDKNMLTLLSFRASIGRTLSVYQRIMEQGIPETSKKSTEYSGSNFLQLPQSP